MLGGDARALVADLRPHGVAAALELELDAAAPVHDRVVDQLGDEQVEVGAAVGGEAGPEGGDRRARNTGGVVKFDETGQNTLSATYLIQLQGKAYKSVWPENRATAKLEWPMAGWRK